MENLKKNKIHKILHKAVLDLNKPILGICVGMQLMAEFSEENGKHKGLNWIPGKVMKIPSSKKFMVPHVGWNDLNNTNDSILFNNKIKKRIFILIIAIII